MKMNQARVLIAGPESEARLLVSFTQHRLDPGIVDLATSKKQAYEAIDKHAQTVGVDIIVTAARLADGTTARELVDHADLRAPGEVPSVLLYSAVHNELEAGKRAIPQAQTLVKPFELFDFAKKLRDMVALKK